MLTLWCFLKETSRIALLAAGRYFGLTLAMKSDKGRFRRPTAEEMSQYQAFAVEQTSDDFSNMPGHSKVSDQGGLYEERVPYIEAVHYCRYTQKGVCGGKDFHKSPHYGLDPAEEEGFLQKARENGLPVKRYGRARWQTTNHMTMVDLSTPDESDATVTRLIQLVDSLDMEGVFGEYCEGMSVKNVKDDSSRNAHQQNFGFTGGHSLARVDECHLRPQLVGGEVDEAWAKRMAAMTEIADTICSDPRSDGFRPENGGLVYDDSHRNKMYANTIHEDNRGEALSCNITGQHRLLFIHLDISNDGTKRGRKANYHYHFSVWECFIDPSTGEIVRVCLIVYSRKSICDSINREHLCQDFTNDELVPWVNGLPRYRKCLEPGSEIFKESYFGGDCELDDHGNMFFPPLVNKQIGHGSAFEDAHTQVRK